MIPGFTVINNQNLHILLDKVNFSSVLKEALIKKTVGEYTTAKADIPTDAEVLNEVKKSVKKDSHMESLINRYTTATDPKVKANAKSLIAIAMKSTSKPVGRFASD